MTAYTIKPVFLGNFDNFEKSVFTYKKDAGVGMTTLLASFLIEGGGRTILVDTGPPHPEAARTMTHRKVANAVPLADALAHVGASPEGIDTVVLTHLHWDHCYNLELFHHCPIYVQKAELQYAVAPLPTEGVPYNYDIRNGYPAWFAGFQRMKVIEGDFRLADGVDLVFLPGHSPGIQGVSVSTAEGRYLLASDNYPLYENIDECIPSGNHVDLREWFASDAKMRAGGYDFILPSHDTKVMARGVYGLVGSQF